MLSFIKISIAVTIAEFPNYKLVASFQIFSAKRCANLNLVVFYGVDEAGLKAEFMELLPVA
eukprot:5782984-Lingulodinium_polyedra.AAC.1